MIMHAKGFLVAWHASTRHLLFLNGVTALIPLLLFLVVNVILDAKYQNLIQAAKGLCSW